MDGLHPTQLRGGWGPAHILGHKNGQRITSSAFQMRPQTHGMGHQSMVIQTSIICVDVEGGRFRPKFLVENQILLEAASLNLLSSL